VGEVLRLGLILMMVSLVAAVALGFVNAETAPIIEQQERMRRQEAMREVTSSLGDSLQFDSLAVEGLANPYAMVDRQLAVVAVSDAVFGDRLGYTFVAYGKGYSSTVQTMVGVDTAGRIVGCSILYQQETPGLGANAANKSWIGQFEGKRISQCSVRKDGGEIDSITGATITSRTVSDSVREGLEAMREQGMFDGGEEG
jgi:electron transport complex protein RnfG